MTTEPTKPKTPRATAIKPRRMWAKESDDNPSVIFAWPKRPSPACNAHIVMVYDLSEPSVADLRDKVQNELERFVSMHCFPYDAAEAVLAALGLTAKRKGRK